MAGAYSLPAGSLVTDGVDDILAAQHNDPLQDLASDANTARPVVAGGTGADNAPDALVNLGLTATAAELNVLDGITATTAELNILDGVTATAAELNHVDGVTSNIQTQLDAKQATITVLPLANGGTGSALVDPGADRILFWDDSAGEVTYLEVGTGLSITDTTLNGTGSGTVGPTNVNSGSAVDFTVPSTATRIIVQFDQVSLTGTEHILVQLGDSGGIETTGYLSGSRESATLSTSGFVVFVGNSSREAYGEMTLTRVGTSNRWSSTHSVSMTTISCAGGGVKTLSDAITTVRITRTGSDSFDGSGVVSIRYME
jgi:hypothetical protein